MRRTLWFSLLLFFSLFYAQAQDEGGETDPLEKQFMVETMKSRALDAVSREDFTDALEILDTAIALAPDDQLLQDMKLSVQELLIISEETPTAATVDTDLPDFYHIIASKNEDEEDQDVTPPDFAEELIAGRKLDNPEQYRESLIASLGGYWGKSKPVYLEDDAFFQHQVLADSSAEMGVFGDFQYYFAGVERALGVNMRYYGNLLNPDDGDVLLHQVDFGVMLRGFFQETADARTILGFRFAASLLYLNEYIRSEPQRTLANSLTFGVFYSDPFLRHVFRKSEFPKKLVLDLGADYYYLTLSQNSYMIRYSGVLAYKITPDLRMGVSGRLVSTAQDIQVLTGWDLGLQFTFSR